VLRSVPRLFVYKCRICTKLIAARYLNPRIIIWCLSLRQYNTNIFSENFTLLTVTMVCYIVNMIFATSYLVDKISIQKLSKYYELSSKSVTFKILPQTLIKENLSSDKKNVMCQVQFRMGRLIYFFTCSLILSHALIVCGIFPVNTFQEKHELIRSY
jgi:uncharacterized membrane protein YraQ (UPF0718 family)